MNGSCKIMKFLVFYLVLKLITNEVSSNSDICLKNSNCYGTQLCDKIRQSKISPSNQSRMTCFKENLKFTMGTNDPIFKSDGEAPARQIHLDPFCIDQTEVSNLQFYEFVQDSNYQTDVFY